MHPIVEVEIFDVWGIDFQGPFPSSIGNRYILVWKQIYLIATKTNDARVVTKFFKNMIFLILVSLEHS